MYFDFRDSIYINDEVLNDWANRMKNGEEFDLIWDEEIPYWDDYEYHASGNIYDDVRQEVYRRAGISDSEEEEE